jgi:hypothetical protein
MPQFYLRFPLKYDLGRKVLGLLVLEMLSEGRGCAGPDGEKEGTRQRW